MEAVGSLLDTENEPAQGRLKAIFEEWPSSRGKTRYRIGWESIPRCGCGCRPPTIFGRLNNNLVRALKNSSSLHDLQNRKQTSLGASALRRMAHRDCGRLQKRHLPAACRKSTSWKSRLTPFLLQVEVFVSQLTGLSCG